MRFTEKFSLYKIEPNRALLFLFCILVIAIISFQEQITAPVPFALFLYLIGLTTIKSDNMEFRIFSLAFFIGLSYTLFLYYYYYAINGAPYFNVPLSDDSSYERDGLKYAKVLGVFEYGKISPTIVDPSHNSKGYVYFVGLIAKVANFFGGYHTLIPRFVNSFLHAITAVFLYRLCNIYLDKKSQALWIALVFSCFPHVVYLSAHIYRDTFICFAFTYCAYKVLKDETTLFDWITILLILIATSEIRFFSMVMLIVCLIGGVVFVKVKSAWFKRMVLISGGIVAGILVISLTALSSSELEIIQLLVLKQDHYTNLRSSSAYSTGLAAVILQMDLFPFGLIVRPTYLAINPLPFLNFKAPHFINGLGTLVQVTLFFFSVVFTFQNFRSSRFLPLFIMLWGLVLGISLTSFQLRHMVMFYPFLFVVGGLGLYENYQKKIFLINSSFIVLVIGVLFVWLYLFNKLL